MASRQVALLALPPQQALLLPRSSGAGLLSRLLAVQLLLGRSLRSIAAELARRRALLLGWLYGRVQSGRSSLRRFERRYFAVRRWHLALLAFGAYKAVRWGVWLGRCAAGRGTRRELKARMRAASTYEEWAAAAVELDALAGRGGCEAQPPNARTLVRATATLRTLRERGATDALMHELRVGLTRVGGSPAAAAAATYCSVVPAPVRQYICEVGTALRYVAGTPAVPLEERLAFFRELRHAHGRTGLVLSGGGSFGFVHFGVCRVLLKSGLLPRVVSGSSAGAIGASLLCTRTDHELATLVDEFASQPGLDFMANSTPGRLLKHLVAKGTLQDHSVFADRLRRLLGPGLTFAEAYQRSGRILNISVTAADTREPPRLLNYLTAPSVLVWSAVACSSAFPFLFEAQDLLAKDSRGNIVRFSDMGGGPSASQRRWCDGSLEEDLPMAGLREMFGVNRFLVSQCNPHILPVVALKRVVPHRVGRLLEMEFKHRCNQALSLLRHDSRLARLLRLLSQPWEGDITILLPWRAFPLGKAAINFSQPEIVLAMREGQLSTWAQMPLIESSCAVESCIDACLRGLSMQMARLRRRESAALRQGSGGPAGSAARLRRSLPSWMQMSALGLPLSDSTEELGAVLRRSGLGSVDELAAVLAAPEGEGDGSSGAEDGCAPAALSPLLEGGAEGGVGAGAAEEAGGEDGVEGEPPGFESPGEALADLALLSVGAYAASYSLDAIAP